MPADLYWCSFGQGWINENIFGAANLFDEAKFRKRSPDSWESSHYTFPWLNGSFRPNFCQWKFACFPLMSGHVLLAQLYVSWMLFTQCWATIVRSKRGKGRIVPFSPGSTVDRCHLRYICHKVINTAKENRCCWRFDTRCNASQVTQHTHRTPSVIQLIFPTIWLIILLRELFNRSRNVNSLHSYNWTWLFQNVTGNSEFNHKYNGTSGWNSDIQLPTAPGTYV